MKSDDKTNFLLRYEEPIKIIKSSIHPIILFVVLYYTIVTLTFWPIVIWAIIEIIILLGIGIVVIKDVVRDKILHQEVVYHSIQQNNSGISLEEDEVDWSGFDISNYPKENYRKVFWVDRDRITYGLSYNKYILRGYPLGDISVFVWIILSLCATYVYMQKEEFLIGRVWLATAGLLILFLCYVSVEGHRIYIMQCKQNYKYEYLQRQKTQKNVMKMQNKVIDLETKYNVNVLDKVPIEVKDNILQQLKEHNIYLDESCMWYMNQLVHLKDVIILQECDGQSVCVKKTLEARKLGMPEDYYVIAVQEDIYLCGCRWESALYHFSRSLGITRTLYFSLLEYLTKDE